MSGSPLPLTVPTVGIHQAELEPTISGAHPLHARRRLNWHPSGSPLNGNDHTISGAPFASRFLNLDQPADNPHGITHRRGSRQRGINSGKRTIESKIESK